MLGLAVRLRPCADVVHLDECTVNTCSVLRDLRELVGDEAPWIEPRKDVETMRGALKALEFAGSMDAALMVDEVEAEELRYLGIDPSYLGADAEPIMYHELHVTLGSLQYMKRYVHLVPATGLVAQTLLAAMERAGPARLASLMYGLVADGALGLLARAICERVSRAKYVDMSANLFPTGMRMIVLGRMLPVDLASVHGRDPGDNLSDSDRVVHYLTPDELVHLEARTPIILSADSHHWAENERRKKLAKSRRRAEKEMRKVLAKQRRRRVADTMANRVAGKMEDIVYEDKLRRMRTGMNTA